MYQNPEVIYYPASAIKQAVKKFPTPFFLYEEKKLRANCKNFRNAFIKYFPNFQALYAVKANPNPDIVKIIASEGFGTDCSSASEVRLSKKLKLKGMYTGNYTSEEEFKYILNKGQIINLDDISMLPTLAKLGMPSTLSFRINPGVGKATIESNVFAGPDAKYGVPFEKATLAYKQAKALGVKHFGIHMMTGSNVPISEKNYFADIVKKLFEIVAQIKKDTGIEIEFMNMGGGFGVPYRPEEPSLNLPEIVKSIRQVFDQQCKKHNLKEPVLYAEPGRYLTANMGFLVGKVTVIKDGYKKFIGIDASSNDMPRPSIYGAYHHASIISFTKKSLSKNKLEKVSIVGAICENNDQLAKDRLLPKCQVGDIVIIHNSGGHARSMGHNYNGRPRSAEYLYTLKHKFKKIGRAETIQDMYRHTNI